MKRPEIDPPQSLSSVDRGAAFVIGRMIATGDVRARRAALRRIDPLLRGRVDRRVTAALDDAFRAAPLIEETEHRRLAMLDIHDRLPPFDRIAEPELIRSMFDALSRDRGSVERGSPPFVPASAGLWRHSIGSIVAVATIATAVLAYRAFREAPYVALEASGTPSAHAYRDGGRPLHDAQIRAAFETTLPELGVVAARGARTGEVIDSQLATLRRALARPALLRALGPFAADALKHLVTAYISHVRGGTTDAELRAAVARLDASLVKRGLGYRVATIDLNAVSLGLTTFEIRRVEFRRIGQERVSVLHADRLDHMNALYSAFGAVDREAPFILVPVDHADRDAITVYLPLLATPPALTLIDPGTSTARFPWLAAVHASAHDAVERDLIRGGCGAALARTVALLEERRGLVNQWSAALGATGVSVAQPDRYRIDLSRWEAYRNTNPRYGALERNYEALGERVHAEAFACARDKLLATYTPALAQRYVDERRRTALVVPASILDLADVALDEAGARFTMQNTVRSVRASLASLVHSPGTSGILLTSLMRCWTHGGICLRHDEDAARTVLAELERELGTVRVGDVRLIGSEALAGFYRDLVARDPREVQRAAGVVFRRLFGDD